MGIKRCICQVRIGRALFRPGTPAAKGESICEWVLWEWYVAEGGLVTNFFGAFGSGKVIELRETIECSVANSLNAIGEG